MEHPCNTCKKVFARKWALIQHQRTHTGEKPFSCGVCKRAFNVKSSLQRHEKTHTSEDKFACSKCSKKYNTRYNLDKHLDSVHSSKPKFKCAKCGKRYSYRHKLNEHDRLVHTKERPFGCDLCPNAFHRKDQLLRHIIFKHKKREYILTEREKLLRKKNSAKVEARSRKLRPVGTSRCEYCFSKDHKSNDCDSMKKIARFGCMVAKEVMRKLCRRRYKKFRCNDCDESGLGKDWWAQHMAVHEEDSGPEEVEIIQCYHCKTFGYSMDWMEKHVVVHKDEFARPSEPVSGAKAPDPDLVKEEPNLNVKTETPPCSLRLRRKSHRITSPLRHEVDEFTSEDESEIKVEAPLEQEKPVELKEEPSPKIDESTSGDECEEKPVELKEEPSPKIDESTSGDECEIKVEAILE